MTLNRVLIAGIGIIFLTGTLLGQEHKAPRGGQSGPSRVAPRSQQAPPPSTQRQAPAQRPSPERYMMGRGRGQMRDQTAPRGPGAMYGRGLGQGRGQMSRPPQGRPGAPGAMRRQIMPRGQGTMQGPGYPAHRERILPRGGRYMFPLREQRRHQPFRWTVGLGGMYLTDRFYDGMYYGNYSLYPYSDYYADNDFGRIKVKDCPRFATVLADEGVIGLVDDADGAFQGFTIPVGQHLIRVIFEDVEVAGFNVFVQPYVTMTLRCGQ